jgi:hypothetical protein
MFLSTNLKVSLVVLQTKKKVEIRNQKYKKLSKNGKTQILCNGFEPNPSKDINMHEGDNRSF